jgi:hypothetical protein
VESKQGLDGDQLAFLHEDAAVVQALMLLRQRECQRRVVSERGMRTL